MFTASAEFYDLIYGFKDYTSEAAQIAALIRSTHPGARRILDVACGTAEHARLLVEEHGFEVDGLDLDPRFVQIAGAKLPGARVYHADMISFDVPQRYDVVLCLFSAIGYVRTLENVRRTFERFRAHLADNAIVVVEPWFAPGVPEHGRIFVNTATAENATVCRMSHMEVEGRLSRVTFEYLIGRATGIERASETHELGLFTIDETQACFRAAGLVADYDPQGLTGRGLYTARAAQPRQVSSQDDAGRSGGG